jgi:hypothetical protein
MGVRWCRFPLEAGLALEDYDGGVTSSAWRQSSWLEAGLALEEYEGGAYVLLTVNSVCSYQHSSRAVHPIQSVADNSFSC